jgi:hypothetical protein
LLQEDDRRNTTICIEAKRALPFPKETYFSKDFELDFIPAMDAKKRNTKL